MKLMTREGFFSTLCAILLGIFFYTKDVLASTSQNVSIRFRVTIPGSVMASTMAHFDVETNDFSSWGLMVVAIGACSGDWVCTVNGRSLPKSASNCFAFPGSLIEWKTV